MKVMVDADSVGEISSEFFTKTIEDHVNSGDDIKFVCRGIEGRVGDKYDYLRKLRMPVTFTNGADPIRHLAAVYNWRPDVVYRSPQNLKEILSAFTPENLV